MFLCFLYSGILVVNVWNYILQMYVFFVIWDQDIEF